MAAIWVGTQAQAQAPATSAPIQAAAASAPTDYPKLAAAPSQPADVRPSKAWRAAIMSIRSEGERTVRLAQSEHWDLADTAGWAERERALADPPPPITTPSEGDAAAFVKRMQAEAAPPPPKKHHSR